MEERDMIRREKEDTCDVGHKRSPPSERRGEEGGGRGGPRRAREGGERGVHAREGEREEVHMSPVIVSEPERTLFICITL